MKTISLVLSAVSLVGVIYLIYFHTFYLPQKIERCSEIAINFEKVRHQPIDNLEVTNEDISGYIKNMASCLSY